MPRRPIVIMLMATAAAREGRLKAGQVRRKIARLAWPAVLEMTLYTFVWIADTAMVGRLGKEALSAVGLAGQLTFTLEWVLGAIGVGATAMVARYVGADKPDRVRRVSAQALLLGLIIGLFASISLFLVAPFVFRIVRMEPLVESQGTAYMRIVSLGSCTLIPTFVAGGILRGTGDTRSPLFVALLANATNVVLDYLLIFGAGPVPKLGVAGAALATVLGQTVGLFAIMAFVFRRRAVSISPRDILAFDGRLLKRLISVSSPAGLENLLVDGARTCVTFMMAALGTTSFAAAQIAITAESVSFMPGYGLAIAAGVLTGQGLGRKDMDYTRFEIAQCLVLSISVMGILGSLFLLLPRQIIGLFTYDREVVELGATCLLIAAFEQPGIAVAEVLAGAFRGAGDTKAAMKVAAAGAWGVRVPLTYVVVFVLDLSLIAVWTVMVLEWSVRAIIAYWHFRRGRWAMTEI